MCGIVGIIGKGRAVEISTLLERIRHRGPDGRHVWKNETVSLGHARLSIIDLTVAADQPMLDEATGNVVVFNGEIYNYVELKQMVGARYPFKTHSDTEVLLALYRLYGTDMLGYLRGMFALAIFDAQHQQIFLARDRFGIKPLYYTCSDHSFLFASEIKALIHHVDKNDTLNEHKAYEFLVNSKLDTNHQTFYKDVFQLLPASYAVVSSTGACLKIGSYWDFPPPGKRKFDKQAAEELHHKFSETVKIHLRSDVPVGTFLSGGLDSSAVTSFARELSEQPVLPTFSAILPYHHPENALIPRFLDTKQQLVNHSFLLDGKDFFKEIPHVVYHHDEPLLDGSMYAHYKLCQLAGQQQIKVLLSGSGGDELFGGYASYLYASQADLLRKMKWRAYWKEINSNAGVSGETRLSLLVKSLYENLSPQIRQNIKRWRWPKQYPHVEPHLKVTHYFHQHADLFLSNLINNYKSWTAPPFLHYEDRNSMAFGIETRVPFFDHELIEFVLQFNHQDIMHGRTKNMMRTAFRGTVPDFILDQRGKYGFPSPINHALKVDPVGKELFYGLIAATPMLNAKKTRELGDRFYEGKADVSVFWRTLSFMIWHQLFFNQRTLTI